MIKPETISAITTAFPAIATSEFRGKTRAVAPRESLGNLLRHLKDKLGFDFLVDVTCVDYLNYRDAENRFGLVYELASTTTNERLTVRTFVDEPDLTVP